MGFYANRLFPWILDNQLDREVFQHERNQALKEVSGEVLEIGFGTGLNLPHYPDEVKEVAALDIISCKNKKIDSRIRASGIDVNFHLASGERMPFMNDRFDFVVSTWTLCSIPDLNSALIEIHRVLKPKGRFVFLEHGLAERKAIQKLQRFFTPLQKILACGCHLDRDIDGEIERAGFKFIQLDTFKMGGALSTLAGSMYRGVAIPVLK